MKEVVVWSGGADSTYLLNDLAKKSSQKNPVYAISVITELINKEKQKLEIKARKKILKWMKNKGYHIKHITINHKFNYNGLFGGNVHNGQPTLFLCQIMCIVPIDSNIHFGYVFEDSFWHGKQLFINAFSKLKELRSVGGEYNFSLYFDLEWIHKKDIIKSLKKDGLLKLIHTCETPVKGKPCGKCLKCIEIKQE